MQEPVALQSLGHHIYGGPIAHLDTDMCVPDELARALLIRDPLYVWPMHELQPPAAGKRQEIRSEPLPFILVFRIRPSVEVLPVEDAQQFDVHSPDCDMVKLHCVHLRSSPEPTARR